MDEQRFGARPGHDGPPSLSSQTLSQGYDVAGRTAAQSTGVAVSPASASAPAAAAAAAAEEESRHASCVPSPSSRPPSASSGGDVLDHRVAAPRPRRSWETAFLANTGGGGGGGGGGIGGGGDGGGGGTDSAGGVFRPRPPSRVSSTATPAVAGAGAGVATGAGAGSSLGTTTTTAATATATEGAMRGGGALVDAAGGVAGSDDDLTDADEGVMARLVEFTDMARGTAIQNEELSRELAVEKRRVAHATRKLEQSSITCTELRESLALAQDTVMKLREHETSWAETTASEMSLRAELCARKDEYSSVSGDASVLRKRCDVLQRENAELGERLAALAEEKRQLEARARRLLRSDRYRGY